MKWKLPVAILLIAAVLGGVGWASGLNMAQAKSAIAKLMAGDEPKAPEAGTSKASTRPAFSGLIAVTPRQIDSIGLKFVKVEKQTEPMLLSINGRTDYDPNTLTKVRPKFKSLIDKIYVGLGQEVKEGDKLVDVYSAELAKAKGEYQKAVAQWERDKIELRRTEDLVKKGGASEKDLVQDQSDEKQSAIAAEIAKDSLGVFGLTDAEIAAVAHEDGIQKARMTLRAPASGIVINRDAVKGNIYDDNDVLLTIAPLDHFWVHGYVYPSDANRVQKDQGWIIHCDTIGQDLHKKVDSITSEIDPETHTLKIRTQIDNIKGRVRANMLVRSELEIQPVDTHSVIPRVAMVSTDGGDYVFVREPGDGTKEKPDHYDRRKVRVIQEKSDHVILGDGVQAGEEVATRGSLILMQVYEDEMAKSTGNPQ